MGDFECTQICLNGHVINRYLNLHPENNRNFCPKCGQPTIHQCPECNKEIEERFIASEFTDTIGYNLDKSKKHQFCGKCGMPYPWTKAKFESAKKLIMDLKGLSDEEKALLRENIEEVLRDSPNTELATAQFIKCMIEAEGAAFKPLQALINDVASEEVKTRLQIIDVKRKMKKSRRIRQARLASLKRQQSSIIKR